MQKRTMLFFLLVFCSSLVWAQEAIETNESKEEKKKTEKPAKTKADKPDKVEKPVKEEKANPRASGLAIPKNMFEFGLNGGMTLLGSDVKPKPSYGVGLHWRKAVDYVFSLRGDLLYADLKGANEPPNIEREFQTQWFSGTLYGVMSLNSLRWDKSVRSTNLYVMGGAGVNSFEANSFNTDDNVRIFDTLAHEFAPHVGVGAGISFRLSNRINIALENQAQMVFGNRADKIDNIQPTTTRSIFRDVVSFTNLNINFNIGSSSKKTEPLYWINPMDGVMNSIDDKINQRTTGLIKDEDGDGVIDAIDQDPNTPAGAMVDTKGRTLDSDRDGVPDHIDKEPFYMPQANEKVDEQGVVVNPQPGSPGRPGTGGGVTEERVKELIDQALQNYQIADNRSSAAEWFLPMLHFPNSSSQIKYSDYGNLAGVGRMMKANPNIRLVVTGFTDSTGSESVNNQLSFERAKNVIEHMVNSHGIARGRFVLQWKGSADNLVPTNSSYMNRRAEFRIAGPGDVEQDPPAPKEGGY
jgi:outer membrane protein OmpA-like peptidoglycan-associated protein